MAQNIGEAVVRILADSSAFDRAVSKLGDNTSKSLVAGTRGLSDRAADIGEKFGSSIGRVAGTALKRGLQVAAVGVAAAVGTVLVKGFKRFTTIQDATASLTLQLGSATKAASLLGKVLKVVEGTPFALDQFVDAARNLVAASVPLEKVPRILQAVGDAAAAAGGSAQDVNEVVDSIGRLATGAQATLGPIRELEAKGVPALRILANQAGISANDMAKKISAGTVDSKKAIDDLVEGILNGTEGINGATVAFGGAALAVGNTVSGAFSNMQTAIARAGAKIITVFADGGKGGDALVLILNSVRETIDILGDRAADVAKRIVGSEGFGRVLAFFEALPRSVEKSFESFEDDKLQGFLGSINFAAIADKVTDGILRAFETLPHARISEIFTKFIIAGISGIAENAAQITAAIIKAAPAIIAGIATGLAAGFAANPLDVGVLIVAMGLPVIGPAVTAALAGIFGALPLGGPVAALIRTLGTALQSGFALLFSGSLVSTVGAGLSVVFSSPAVLVAAGAAIGLLTSFLVSKIGGLLGTIVRTLLAVNPATRLIAFMAQGFREGFPALLERILSFFRALPGRVVSAGSSLVSALAGLASRALRAMLGAVVSGGGAVLSFVRGLPGRILGALGSLGGLLVGAGRALMSGLFRGIVAGAQAVYNYVASIARKIADLKGPLDKDYKLLVPAGEAMMQGLNDAIRGQFGTLATTLADVTGVIGGGVPIGRFPTQDAARATTAPGLPAGVVQHITVNEAVDGQATADWVVTRIGAMVQR